MTDTRDALLKELYQTNQVLKKLVQHQNELIQSRTATLKAATKKIRSMGKELAFYRGTVLFILIAVILFIFASHLLA